MSYQTVKDVLDQSAEVHRGLQDYYDAVSQQTESERLVFLLRSASRRDEVVEQVLEGYDAQTRQGLLDTWLQYTPEDTLKDEFRAVSLDPDMSEEQVINAILTYEQAVTEAYRQIARQTSIPRVEEFFTTLVEFKEFQGRMFSWDALESQQHTTLGDDASTLGTGSTLSQGTTERPDSKE